MSIFGARSLTRPEVHHIASGSLGNRDLLCLMAMLCRECHAKVNSAELPLGRVLFLKWKHDREHTDWIATRRALGRLPDLITDEGEA